MGTGITSFFQNFFSNIYFPNIGWNDVVEIILLSFFFYRIILWLKNTKAWSMLKGVIVILIIVFIAYIFNMRTITWIAKRSIDVAIIAFVILLQPEIRHALEKIGNRVFKAGKFKNGSSYERFSENTMKAIVNASFDMGKVKTGALIVIEQELSLSEYINTGIDINGLVSSQLLINIFEKDTPLHDGAVIMRNDRIVAATCYLPLTRDEDLSKDLGTRHRAAIGVSEEYDCFTIIVSEETGKVSVTYGGRLLRNVERNALTMMLEYIRKTPGGKSPIAYYLNNKDAED